MSEGYMGDGLSPTQPISSIIFTPPQDFSDSSRFLPPSSEPLEIPIHLNLPVDPSITLNCMTPNPNSNSNSNSDNPNNQHTTPLSGGFAGNVFGRRGSIVPTRLLNVTKNIPFPLGGGGGHDNSDSQSGDSEGKRINKISREDEEVRRIAILERSRQEEAMAKWRKWVIDQPITVIPIEPISLKPLKNGRHSHSHSQSNSIPMVPINTSPSSDGLPKHLTSPLFPPSPSPTTPSGLARMKSPESVISSPRGSASNESMSMPTPITLSSHAILPLRSSTMGSGTTTTGDLDVFNTESVMALQDTELAIDMDLLKMAAERAAKAPRRMSTQPRIADGDNPFFDVASRLGSRRVRPFVVELVQALGHYIDACWCLTYPDQPCPWISERVHSTTTSPQSTSIIPSRPTLHTRRTTSSSKSLSDISNTCENPLIDGCTKSPWRSNMITAVQEGKRMGLVADPPGLRDLDFFEEEVKQGIRDVDEAVGIYKGVGWAFGTAMIQGRYGVVERSNVLGDRGEGGNIARLLNDLEEALWGDAPARPTDLSYDLPIDFDPFNSPEPNDFSMKGMTSLSGLRDFFSDPMDRSRSSASHPTPVTPYPENFDGSDFIIDITGGTGCNSQTDTLRGKDRAEGEGEGLTQQDSMLNLAAFGIGEREMSLEEKLEIGKKRHLEWLAIRDSGW